MNNDIVSSIFKEFSYYDQLFYSRHFKFFKIEFFKVYFNNYLKKYKEIYDELNQLNNYKYFIVGDSLVKILKNENISKIDVYIFEYKNDEYHPTEIYDFFNNIELITSNKSIKASNILNYFSNEKVIFNGEKLYFMYNKLFFNEFDIMKIKLDDQYFKLFNFDNPIKDLFEKIPHNKILIANGIQFKNNYINLLKYILNYYDLIYTIDDIKNISKKTVKKYESINFDIDKNPFEEYIKTEFDFAKKKFKRLTDEQKIFFKNRLNIQKIVDKYDLASFNLTSKFILRYLRKEYKIPIKIKKTNKI